MNEKEVELINEGAKIGKYIYDKEKSSRVCRWSGKTIEFKLSASDIYSLLRESGITMFDVGNESDSYVLGRDCDFGDYELGNCKFVTKSENSKEMHRVDKHGPQRMLL